MKKKKAKRSTTVIANNTTTLLQVCLAEVTPRLCHKISEGSGACLAIKISPSNLNGSGKSSGTEPSSVLFLGGSGLQK